MSRIVHTCSECGRIAKEISRTPVLLCPDQEAIDLECGHFYLQEKTGEFKCPDFQFEDGTSPYPFQKENIELAVRSGFRCGIFDEMGLGKTISSLGILRLADLGLIERDKIFPVAILVKAGLRYQWLREVWNKLGHFAQLVDKEPNFENFEIFIFSQDGLRNNPDRDSWPFKTIILDECQQIKNDESKRTKAVLDLLRPIQQKRVDNPNPLRRQKIEQIAKDLIAKHNLANRFDLVFTELDKNHLGLTQCRVRGEGEIHGKIIISRHHAENDPEPEVIETILHEIAHAITPGAGHKPIWSDTCKSIGGNGQAIAYCEGTVEPKETISIKKNFVALSGTPIKNHAGEFFPVLNAIAPEKFPSKAGFLKYWTSTYYSGQYQKIGGLRDPKRFSEFTKDFLIRHERKDVLPDLPPIQRNFQWNILASNLEDSYNDELKEFVKKYEESKSGQELQNVLAIMARMRHIVGLSKTNDAVNWVSEFCEQKENELLTVFHHHEDVGKILFVGLSRFSRENGLNPPLWISEPGISDEERNNRVGRFIRGDNKILIASTLKSGEGLNLQACSNCLIVERQWNSANEEQAEGRFSRIGSTAEKISANYLTCANSIDEFFSEIVERKREIVNNSNNAISGKNESVTKWDETSVMKELANVLYNSGLKKFSLKAKVKENENQKVLTQN